MMKAIFGAVSLFCSLLFVGALKGAEPDPCQPTISTAALQTLYQDLAPDLPPSASQYVYFLVGLGNSGKGTAGRPFASALGLWYGSTGDILREITSTDSPITRKIKPIMDSGRIIETSDLMPVLEAKLDGIKDRSRGFVLDGSPRRLNEAMQLETMILKRGWRGIRVIYFDIPTQDVFERASGRQICSHKSCGQSYHVDLCPPMQEGICDLCGAALKQRADDASPMIVQQRITAFESETLPVVSYFEQKGMLIRLDAGRSRREVALQLLSALKQLPY